MQVIGRGISHPQPCTMTDRRANVQSILLEDPKGAEMAAHALVKQKGDTSRMDTSSMKLATRAGERPISKAGPSRSNEALFLDKTVPVTELQRLMVVNNLSKKQTGELTKFVRSWKGRNFFESGAREKLRDGDKVLESFFSVDEYELDSSVRNEREGGQKVNRQVVYCNDVVGLIAHLRKHREIHPEANIHIKFGIDGGGKFLKICLNLIADDGALDVKPRFLYAEGASSSKFKDLSLRRVQAHDTGNCRTLVKVTLTSNI